MNATNLSVYNHSGGILHIMNITLELDYHCLPVSTAVFVTSLPQISKKCKQCLMTSIDDITLIRA